ncbi:hypothetical protein F4694_004063 [Bacillus niacini]|uniref:Siphovirus-type tail component RIFT-related domain-containing protein n=1 Tax=Neobacillus niacini TaxID=86668 RepID=A0A852TJ64_9BACI|nr:phage tail family protein [Neobacillus niacini]NYE07278.1 hypothetical protein [Neobacillus niacini]
MEIAIQRLTGALYNLADYGIKTLDFQIDAPSPRVYTEVVEGRDGTLDLGAVYDSRQLRGSFYMSAVDSIDFALLRNEVFRIFAGVEEFYLIDSREPGKRWKVRSNGFSVEQLTAKKGRFDVDFTAAIPYAESIGTTLDPLTFDTELWQIGQGIIDDGLVYTHTTSSFRIYNLGDTTVNPRQHPLVITFTGASNNLKIQNVTTGEEWTYTGVTTAGDSVKLDSIQSTKNGLSIFRDTNRKVISIVPGWNDFVITGASGLFTLSFDFRFYYL